MTVLIGNGDGTFTPTGVSPATGIKPTSLATGDFNGDGKLDLAVANYGSSNNVTILLGDGTGAFTAESVSPSVGFNATEIVVSDFNGDGRADLAVVNSANNNVTILLGVDTPTQITASPTTGQSATVGTSEFPDTIPSDDGRQSLGGRDHLAGNGICQSRNTGVLLGSSEFGVPVPRL